MPLCVKKYTISKLAKARQHKNKQTKIGVFPEIIRCREYSNNRRHHAHLSLATTSNRLKMVAKITVLKSTLSLKRAADTLTGNPLVEPHVP